MHKDPPVGLCVWHQRNTSLVHSLKNGPSVGQVFSEINNNAFSKTWLVWNRTGVMVLIVLLHNDFRPVVSKRTPHHVTRPTSCVCTNDLIDMKGRCCLNQSFCASIFVLTIHMIRATRVALWHIAQKKRFRYDTKFFLKKGKWHHQS